jgi:hypothetical protein
MSEHCLGKSGYAIYLVVACDKVGVGANVDGRSRRWVSLMHDWLLVLGVAKHTNLDVCLAGCCSGSWSTVDGSCGSLRMMGTMMRDGRKGNKKAKVIHVAVVSVGKSNLCASPHLPPLEQMEFRALIVSNDVGQCL